MPHREHVGRDQHNSQQRAVGTTLALEAGVDGDGEERTAEDALVDDGRVVVAAVDEEPAVPVRGVVVAGEVVTTIGGGTT
ncbi:hypothetical protein AXK56_22565 [Tsukamurella pulmonis]|uniref:Uncharacterized protein n=1 Tax=Tsukamurella pulmonis TaxID=47312 RepID=A0A1H1ACT4_9ACTN|nr:hypothetical protein AXK56_22565 [Tsukamurella pulmonis]SDQ37535.1 hypothetical protein SAMN04489765_0165 [Tsukamurella pulmonis]SUQ39371.1 Uncharacterised protein [Tsukamurella pulmonis]